MPIVPISLSNQIKFIGYLNRIANIRKVISPHVNRLGWGLRRLCILVKYSLFLLVPIQNKLINWVLPKFNELWCTFCVIIGQWKRWNNGVNTYLTWQNLLNRRKTVVEILLAINALFHCYSWKVIQHTQTC